MEGNVCPRLLKVAAYVCPQLLVDVDRVGGVYGVHKAGGCLRKRGACAVLSRVLLVGNLDLANLDFLPLHQIGVSPTADRTGLSICNGAKFLAAVFAEAHGRHRLEHELGMLDHRMLGTRPAPGIQKQLRHHARNLAKREGDGTHAMDPVGRCNFLDLTDDMKNYTELMHSRAYPSRKTAPQKERRRF